MSDSVKSKYEIHLAPLQGYTDKAYRYAFFKCFNSIDLYYSPYLSVNNQKKIDNLTDVNIQCSKFDLLKFVPQILPANMSELTILLNEILPIASNQININLGCPYPMVTRKGRGAALIGNPRLVNEMIHLIRENHGVEVSLKIRSGVSNETDVFDFLNEVEISQLKNIIFHPRTAIQLYKGEANVSLFEQCKNLYADVNFIYNGDINSLEDFKRKQLHFDDSDIMIGRGILKNPFLPEEIRKGKSLSYKQKLDLLQQFTNTLFDEILLDSKDDGHAMNRIKLQFMVLFENLNELKSLRKKIKKTKTLIELKKLISQLV